MNDFVGFDYMVGIVIIYLMFFCLILVCCFFVFLRRDFFRYLRDLENIVNVGIGFLVLFLINIFWLIDLKYKIEVMYMYIIVFKCYRCN